jgi:16S rRNA (uracil1498-N3)-methyltransferase
MKFSRLPRIYANISLIKSNSLNITEDNNHYLQKVLRLKIGDQFRIFNGVDGEFIAQITNMTKNNLSILLTDILRQPLIEDADQIILGISLIKTDRMLDAVNMAVQLGVTKIVPIIAERSQYRSINEQKLLKIIIEATEQCERLNPPILALPTSLEVFVKSTPDITLLYANEHEHKYCTMLEAADKITYTALDISIIVGPEGGFSPNELELFASQPHAISFSLGANILRTETAVATCLAQYALLGRW